MDTIVTAMDTLPTLVTAVFSMITGNPLLTTFCAAGLLGTGIGIYKGVRRASR